MANENLINRDSTCFFTAIEGEFYANCSNKNLQNAPNISGLIYPIVGIDLSINLLSKFPTNLPKTLKYLNVSANSLDRLSRHDIREYPQLIELRMSKCKLKVLESHSLNGSQLRYLDVSGNRQLTLSVLKNISCDLSESFIETLILDELQCPIGPSIVLTRNHVKCLRNTSLKMLSLASNRIVYLDVYVIPTLPESLTVLNFSDNKLTMGLYASQFGLLKSMKVLDFSYQSRIPVQNFENIECTYTEKNCKTEETEREGSEREPKIYDIHPSIYTIYLPQSLEKLYLHDYTVDPKPYRYDAFISYAAENETFAIDVINDLERKSNLKVCFHSRDFIPGTAIADNISNAIQNSRRTVCFVTSHFLQSYWCMFEFNMARMVSFYSRAGENVLILVLLEKYPAHKMPLDMLELMQYNSYLEYPGNFVDKESFTSQLAKHL
ncbi:toll-like receptor 4 [Ostrea edulis]|uniref:toll-like receptor 4 n=1 Tax=Ostrea edulis TaxID=37623 RepID=UPI0024AE9920|nr:toll-like receptor 4 [Ostrea edulis]